MVFVSFEICRGICFEIYLAICLEICHVEKNIYEKGHGLPEFA